MTSKVDATLRQMGAIFDPDVLQRTRALYREPVNALPWARRQFIADIAYGPHPRHRLDIFPTDAAGTPILLFVHGGGFVGGDKAADNVFYANVGRYFAANGYTTVTMNYRLAGTDPWPAGNEDVRSALRWIAANPAIHNGDIDRIILLGQSAGAAHVAGLLFHPDYRHSLGGIRGAILMSGFYHAKQPLTGGPLQYFGDDAAKWQERSPASHVHASHPSILLSVAELDPPPIANQTFEFATTLCIADRRPPQLLWLEGHNHVSTVHGLGLGEDSVGRALLEFSHALTA